MDNNFEIIDGRLIEYTGSDECVEIPNSVHTICQYALHYCKSMKSVIIPSSVTLIENFAFTGCDNLESIIVEKGNAKYYSEGNCLIDVQSKTLVLGCKCSVIPDDGSVTAIGSCAFSECNSLKSIHLPSSITSIGDFAFDDCSRLMSIRIPASLKSIGHYAFSGCDDIESITVEHGNSTYYSKGNCLIDDHHAVVLGCKNSVIPDDGSVTRIADYAFDKCTFLESIDIPNTIRFIGEYAFHECVSLESIVIPDSVSSIARCAFYECSYLESVTIPESVYFIGESAFEGCSENLVITTEHGSCTEVYAEKNGIKVKLI